VTSIAWPPERHNELVLGCADGKVKLGALKSNKAYTLYAHPSGSYVVGLAASPDGRALLAGHADGAWAAGRGCLASWLQASGQGARRVPDPGAAV
jgi:WD40 repeat protein